MSKNKSKTKSKKVNTDYTVSEIFTGSIEHAESKAKEAFCCAKAKSYPEAAELSIAARERGLLLHHLLARFLYEGLFPQKKGKELLKRLDNLQDNLL